MDVMGKWESRIYAARDRYIASLPDPEMMITMTGVFTGCLMYIYRHVFRPEYSSDVITRSVLNTDKDIRDIYDIFDVFADLCVAYNHPTLVTYLNYGIMTGIDKNVFDDAINGTGGTPAFRDFVKKILCYSESMLAGNVSERNSIGSMFLLKCKYDGYVEQTAPQQIEIKAGAPQISRADILALTAADPGNDAD